MPRLIILRSKFLNMLETLSKTENEALKEFKEGIIKKIGEDILFVWLFGSRARRNFQKESDTDILVVLKNPTEEQIDFIYEVAMNIGMNYGIYLSVKIFSEKEFNYYKSIPTRFINNVLREGIMI